MSRQPDRLIVVAGTGTEVGKTWVAARTIEALRRAGSVVEARKPAQSFDVTDDPTRTDAALLGAASGEDVHVVCPEHRWYSVAMAPPMAADSLGRSRIHLAELVGEVAASWSPTTTDLGIVELAGGPWSPAAHDGDGVDLTRLLHPDHVVLVADAGLGTLNVVRPAVAALGVFAPVTVVLNRYDDGSELHRRNLAWLREHEGILPVTSSEELAVSLVSL